MSWTVELFPDAEKQYKKLARNTRDRIRGALTELEECENPLFHRQVIPLVGRLKGYCRLRVGDYRVIFEVLPSRKVIAVHRIVPRSQAYR